RDDVVLHDVAFAHWGGLRALAGAHIVGVRRRGGKRAYCAAHAGRGHNQAPTMEAMPTMDALTDPNLRGAAAFQQLHWLASGRIDAAHLTHAYAAAIARENPRLNAYLALDPRMEEQAA